MDLESYARQSKRGGKRSRCLTCKLPDEALAQIHAARAKAHPTPFPTISEWVEAEYKTYIQGTTIRNHFVAGHHREA